jgi:DNA-binding MarR family transcriptional regulator
MTPKQKLVLEIVCDSPHGHSMVEDIAFEAQTTPQAVGKIVAALSSAGLVSRQRFAAGKWEIWPTDEGRKEAANVT